MWFECRRGVDKRRVVASKRVVVDGRRKFESEREIIVSLTFPLKGRSSQRTKPR